MRIIILTSIIPLSTLVMITLISPALAKAPDISVQIGLPPLVIPGPPGLIVVPNAYVYYPPEVNENIFFYRGNWYRPHRGHWFSSPHYNGPWDPVVIKESAPSGPYSSSRVPLWPGARTSALRRSEEELEKLGA